MGIAEQRKGVWCRTKSIVPDSRCESAPVDYVFIVLVYLACVLPGALTSAHAARIEHEVWTASGRRQMHWTVAPLLATLCFPPIAIGMSVTYVRRVLPELRRLHAARTGRPATF